MLRSVTVWQATTVSCTSLCLSVLCEEPCTLPSCAIDQADTRILRSVSRYCTHVSSHVIQYVTQAGCNISGEAGLRRWNSVATRCAAVTVVLWVSSWQRPKLLYEHIKHQALVFDLRLTPRSEHCSAMRYNLRIIGADTLSISLLAKIKLHTQLYTLVVCITNQRSTITQRNCSSSVHQVAALQQQVFLTTALIQTESEKSAKAWKHPNHERRVRSEALR